MCSALIERWVRTGSANPGPKILTVVAAMLAGGTHIDHVGMLRAGRTGRVLGFRPMAPSTVGSFLRTFTFGHVRQLEAVLSRTLARAWGLGAGPGEAPLVVDLDSTICEVHGKQKQGAAYGYTNALGYHPLLAARADTGEVLGARMRKGSAGSSRGVVRFVDELVANLRRAGAAGPTTVRADSGFWSRKLIDRLDAHDVKWSITVALGSAVRAAIQAIPEHRMDRHRLHQQRPRPSRRDRPTPPAAAKPSAPFASSCAAPASPRAPNNDCGPTGDTTHSTPTPNTDTAAADEFHRAHAVVELAIRDLKEGTGLEHVPSGHYGANCAPLACAVLAHNIGHWTNRPCRRAAGHEPLPPHPTRRPRRRRGQPLPGHTHPAIPPPAGPGKHNSEPHSAPCEPFPDPPAKQHLPGTDAPTQTQRRQPRTTPAPLAQHAQTHQTTPPTTRRDPNPPPTREPAPAPLGPALTKGQSVDSG